jgi:DNA processing protein
MAPSIRRDFAQTDFETAKALITWNALAEPGDRLAGELISRFGPVEALEVFRNRRTVGEDFLAAFERWAPRDRTNLAEDKIADAKKSDLKLLLPSDLEWPIQLNDLGGHAPLLLWYQGSIDVFQRLGRVVALVGSRNATHYGQRVTSELCGVAVDDGAAIVSGGALGIDAVAHRATLARGGTTIAFMAGSLDIPYPSGNLELFQRIAHTGLLLSEMAPGSRPTRWRFLQRNRLIAALCEGLVVAEAGWRSGSINSVNHAVELGRKVFAIPGPINSPASAGCNRLIRDGMASILLEVGDLASELGWRNPELEMGDNFGTLELRALDAVSRKGSSFDHLLVESGLSASELRIALGNLKLNGAVEILEKNVWKRSR